jgi:hypothetical protein
MPARGIGLAGLAAMTLDALAKMRKLRTGEPVQFARRETSGSFVQIESV